jgi:hypothetical protein
MISEKEVLRLETEVKEMWCYRPEKKSIYELPGDTGLLKLKRHVN